jgi:hypothetical protein
VEERHKGHVWGVYVTAALRGTGIGRSVMCALLEHAARVKGIEQLGLLVATTQAAAMELYQTLGFRSFGCERWALKIGERYVDEEHMVLAPDTSTNRTWGSCCRQMGIRAPALATGACSRAGTDYWTLIVTTFAVTPSTVSTTGTSPAPASALGTYTFT